VQDAIKGFNDRAQQHEQAYARWLQQQINAGLTPAQINEASAAYVGQHAGWEVSEQIEMYQLLLAAHNASLQNGVPDELSRTIGNIIAKKTKELAKQNTPKTCAR
jgi:hypothetical protein